VFTNHDRT